MPIQETVLASAAEALVRGSAGREPPVGEVDRASAGGQAERAFEATMQDVSKDMSAAPVRAMEVVQQSERLQGKHAVGISENESAGDAILGGLRSIRGMFDEQISRAAILGREKSATNTSDLIIAQAAITQLTVMIDVTAKLAGKLTQSCDTLLKG